MTRKPQTALWRTWLTKISTAAMHLTCRAKGTSFTWFQPGANLEAIKLYSIQDSVWLLLRAGIHCTEVGDVQAMHVTTPDCQQQDASQDIEVMEIIPPDDQLVPGDLQVMDINQHIDNEDSQGSTALSYCSCPWWFIRYCKIWNSQHLNRVAVSNFTTSLHGQPTTLSCPLKNLWQKLVPCLW